jgi:hypothetical protein
MSAVNRSMEIVMSFGDPDSGRLVSDQIRSKTSKDVHTMVLSTRQFTKENPELDILKCLDSKSRITIIAHSKPMGTTFQFDNLPNETYSISERTRHFTDIVDVIASKLTKERFSPQTPHHLRISLRSCYCGRGETGSLGARFQRHFAVTHNIYCQVTARTELLFIDIISYTLSDGEYFWGCFQKRIIRHENGAYYLVDEKEKSEHHQKSGSKMLLFWDADGQQFMSDAYTSKPSELSQCPSPETAEPSSTSVKGVSSKLIGVPVTIKERKGYETFDSIVEKKLEKIQAKLNKQKEIINVIKTYYLYQLKYELNTDMVDDIIQQIDQLLENHIPGTPFEMLKLFKIKANLFFISNGGIIEGLQRARREGIVGIPRTTDYIKACSAKRKDFAMKIMTFITELEKSVIL